jgi:NTE family protein
VHPVQHRRTAFVFAGGGSLGAIQVGMLRALSEHGVRPDMVVGSSVGAVNGAFYAGAPDADGIGKLEAIWRQLRRSTIFPITLSALTGSLWGGSSLVSPCGLETLVSLNLPYEQLEDAEIPIHIVATDLLTGQPVVLSEGAAVKAVLASSAIPAVFPPVVHRDRLLVDGAITSNTPVEIAVGLGARRLIVLSTGFACPPSGPPKGVIASALHSLTLIIARQLTAELERLDADIDYAIVPTLCPLIGSPYDFKNVGDLIDQAATATEAWIRTGGLTRRTIPLGMRPAQWRSELAERRTGTLAAHYS